MTDLYRQSPESILTSRHACMYTITSLQIMFLELIQTSNFLFSMLKSFSSLAFASPGYTRMQYAVISPGGHVVCDWGMMGKKPEIM